jgi:hypothetical protein
MLYYVEKSEGDSLKKAAYYYNQAVKLNPQWHKAWHKVAMAYNDLLECHQTTDLNV